MNNVRKHAAFARSMVGSVMCGISVLCLLGAQTRAGQSVSTENIVIKKTTLSAFRDILASEGYAVTTDKRGVIQWKIEGFRTQIFVAKDGLSVQFHSAFGDGNATLKKVNKWNRTKRYSRSYLDDEGDPHLELDLDLTGGVTQARIQDFLKTCRASFIAWVMEVVK